jgi:Flp pilus assembly pilin Flp
MLKKLMAKMQNEEGQGLVEYALIIFLVSIGCVIALGAMTDQLNVVWGQIVAALT